MMSRQLRIPNNEFKQSHLRFYTSKANNETFISTLSKQAIDTKFIKKENFKVEKIVESTINLVIRNLFYCICRGDNPSPLILSFASIFA